MSRVTRATAHLSVAAVKAKVQQAANATQRQRWLIVYNALIDPRPAISIALHTGVSVATVRLVISQYNRLGPTVLNTPGKGGRRNEYLTLAAEQAFLAPFFERAAAGQIATATEIHQALQHTLEHPVHVSTVYRLLARHGWRKLVPRSYHPKVDPAAQEAFKKTSLQPLLFSPPTLQMRNAHSCSWRKTKRALDGSAPADAHGSHPVCDPEHHAKWFASTVMYLPQSHQPKGR